MVQIIKHFTAGADIVEYCPVKYGSSEGVVIPVTSAKDFVIGIAQSNTNKDSGVDVVLLGESLVNCEGAINGTKPLVANSNGKICQLDLTADTYKGSLDNTLLCNIGTPIEIDSASAYLRCVVNPHPFAIAAIAA